MPKAKHFAKNAQFSVEEQCFTKENEKYLKKKRIKKIQENRNVSGIDLRERKSIKNFVTQLIKIKKTTIRFVARVVGTLVSSFPAVRYAQLHYRHIEKVKYDVLALNKGS